MALATCQCLNVKISIKESDLSNAPDAERNSLSAEAINDEFFRANVKRVHVMPSGIKQEHEYLIHERILDGWSVFTCVICSIHTHAIPTTPDDDIILVNANMLTDPVTIERLHGASNYSPSFRVFLSDVANQTTPLQMSRCNLEFLPYIQQEVNAYLLNEEAAIEDRIRKFEENERSMFTERKLRLKTDKKKLISLVLQNAKEKQDTKTSPKKSLAHSLSIPFDSNVKRNENQKHLKGVYRPMDDYKTRSSQQQYDNVTLDDDDELFQMDGNDDAYEMSEDDGHDTDDSSAVERSSSPSMFSTSVPVNVPAWRMKNSPPHADEDDEGPPDINQIHASIQALAKSVHDSSKEIFGDLPRSRLSGRGSKR